jgi:hypothetical protein
MVSSITEHDIHDFLKKAQQSIESEYARIRKRASEDPGTAGDQGEENWAALFREWLPSYFHIVTKGRILTDTGYASPQIDILVLHPSYPKILLDKKLYLAGGVAAAFECKTTLNADHVKGAVRTAADIRKHLPKQTGSPYKELVSPIIYGLLSHSHSWKNPKSKPIENIERALSRADAEFVDHPIQCLDVLTVADLATWSSGKMTFLSPNTTTFTEALANIYGNEGSASSAYVCAAIGADRQEKYFSPIGALLTDLFSKLAWTYKDMRGLEHYFRQVNAQGRGIGKGRLWPIDIYSDDIKLRVSSGQLSNGQMFDEWSIYF